MPDKFKSKIGLIAATVGSAVGLGNIWRFPAEAQANGGAAFLIIYVVCVLVLGIPLMLTEFSLGRGSGTDAVSTFRKLRPGSKWYLTGILGVIASYMILCFYVVVSGWTLEYFFESLTGSLYEGVSVGNENAMAHSFHDRMERFIGSDVAPLVCTYVMIAANIGVLIGGVKNGIEKFSTWMMPVLFALLLLFCGVSLALPGASKGVSFFLSPDFSKITPAVIINALGQAFFSLSLGLGCLITYASYFPKSTKLTQTAFTVSGLDMLVALLMGLTIFPAVASFGLDHAELRGQTLVFVTMPEIFAEMPGTRVWSILFFLLLMLASLTSTISMAEVSIAFIRDRYRKSRVFSTLVVMLPVFVVASLCSLSFGSLNGFRIFGLTIFELFDSATTNVMLPVGGLLICLFMGWFAPKGFFRKELTPSLADEFAAGRLSARPSSRVVPMIYGVVEFLVRWVVPPLILIILLSPLF